MSVILMTEKCEINFNNLTGELIVWENNILVKYSIQVSQDRKTAFVIRNRYQKNIYHEYECIGCEEEYLTLYQIKNDPNRNELFQWLSHGVFGIPLSYGKQE